MSDADRVIAEHDIQKVIHQVYERIDRHQYDQAVLLFTANIRHGTPPHMAEGREEVAKLMGRRPKTVLSRHIITSIVVDLTGEDTANATGTLIGYLNQNATPEQCPVPVLAGPSIADCRFKLRKVDGAWQIEENDRDLIFDGKMAA